MAYKAVVDFKDLLTGHDYKAGDAYPFDGNADKDRVRRLITPTEQRGALIEETSEDAPAIVERKRSKKTVNKAEKPEKDGKEKK